MTALSDTTPSPWWPCPQCGDVHFKTQCVFERGRFFGDVYVMSDPPTGHPTGVVVSAVECANCGYQFNIREHYNWPVVGTFEGEA